MAGKGLLDIWATMVYEHIVAVDAGRGGGGGGGMRNLSLSLSRTLVY